MCVQKYPVFGYDIFIAVFLIEKLELKAKMTAIIRLAGVFFFLCLGLALTNEQAGVLVSGQ